MASPRFVHFNALPSGVREQLARRLAGTGDASGPILSDRPSMTAAILGWGSVALCGLALLGFSAWWDFGELWSSSSIQGAGWLVLYAGGGFLTVWGILRAVRRAKLESTLPFPPGRYAFARDIIDASDEVLKIYSMGDCLGFDGAHHHENGAYTHTIFSFTFSGEVQSFTIGSQIAAEQALGTLRATQDLLAQAGERLGEGTGTDEDVGMIAALDPFFEARIREDWESLGSTPPSTPDGEGPRTKALPKLFSKAAIIAVVVGAVLAPPVWLVRNKMSDNLIWEDAQRSYSSSQVRSYIRRGGAHVEEAKKILVQFAFREARQKGTVTAFRRFLKEWPDHELAKAELHQLYVTAAETFEGQASKEDPKLVPFMRALVDHLEKKASTRVDVRFKRPPAELLAALDKGVTKTDDGLPVAPVAPHFSHKTAGSREGTIVRALQGGFTAVFPQDLLKLEHVKSTTWDPKAPVQAPTIDLSYIVAPSGAFYSGEKNDRAFIGIFVNFLVTMRVPGYDDEITFELNVQPPQRFTVESRFLAFGMDASTPADSLVYTVMAARAFDELSTKLRLVFFDPKSRAFMLAKGALEAASRPKPKKRFPGLPF